MKFFNLLSFATLVLVLSFSSCSNNDESIIAPNPLLGEIESYGIVTEKGEEAVFKTQQELLDYLEVIDKSKYEEVKEKFEFLNRQLDVIHELGLVNKSEDDPVVLKYLSQFDSEDETPEKTGALNFCHFGYNQTGTTVWTPVTNPRIRRSSRNQYSSITAIASQVLCTRTWFRGTHKFYWGTHDNLGYPMDNNAESYY